MLVLNGCVYYPRTVEVYDEDCEITVRKEVLHAEQVAAISNCSNEACLVQLGIFSAVSATSAIISGSIVVVKNVVYWMEKQGACTSAEQE